EDEDEGKQDEAAVAQEQIIQIIAARDKHAATAALQKPPNTPLSESRSQEFLPIEGFERTTLPATTTT
ncbi:unnamed protein product, partial [Rotaria magnacalcarata]